MMSLADKGEFGQAVALGQDLATMIEHVGSSSQSGVIRLMLGLGYAECLGSAVDDLMQKYPGAGFETLQASKIRLAEVYQAALPRTVKVEAAYSAYHFEQFRSGDAAQQREADELAWSATMCDLRITQGELAYLNFAEQVEEKLTRGLTQDLDEEVKKLHPLAAALTPSWSRMAERTRTVAAQLRKSAR